MAKNPECDVKPQQTYQPNLISFMLEFLFDLTPCVKTAQINRFVMITYVLRFTDVVMQDVFNIWIETSTKMYTPF